MQGTLTPSYRHFYFMEIVCKNCGLVNDYRTEMKNGQNVAHCNGCGKYIKNIPYNQTPKLYFGKYKDRIISEIEDLNYLQWLVESGAVRANIKQAVIDRIAQLKIYGQ